MLNSKLRRERRIKRARCKIVGTASVPRLAFTKSAKYLYAQLVDDTAGKSVANYTTAGNGIFKDMKSRKNKEAAAKFGEFVGAKIKEKGIKRIVFDRRGRKYHGVVKEFADALRKSGAEF